MSDASDLAQADLRQDLGDGLVLRWSTAADVEPIAQLLGTVFRASATAPINTRIQARVRFLMRGDSPLMAPGDFAVVQDTARDDQPIIACSCLWHHTWEFAGIPIRVGRPEYVAADIAYRQRGLIRAIFAALHARSAAVGHQVQVITGINHFYRQFGYEYALDLDGMRLVNLTQIPAAPTDTAEPYQLRDATEADIPQLQALHAQHRAEALVWNVMPAEDWRYQIVDLAEIGSPGISGALKMIADQAGAVVGYLHVSMKRWSAKLGIYEFVTTPGTNLRAVVVPILRALAQYGQTVPNVENNDPFCSLAFHLGREHPVYAALGPELAPYYAPPYAWYVRVPDVAGFLRLITPALEQRLAASILAGYTGAIKLDWYRGGLQLVFDHGKLTTVEPWQAPPFGDEANAGSPPLVFLQLLFGYRSLDELRQAFPDVWANDETRILLNVLFPKQISYITS